MPRTITPVVWGRCRPTPDRVSEGASSGSLLTPPNGRTHRKPRVHRLQPWPAFHRAAPQAKVQQALGGAPYPPRFGAEPFGPAGDPGVGVAQCLQVDPPVEGRDTQPLPFGLGHHIRVRHVRCLRSPRSPAGAMKVPESAQLTAMVDATWAAVSPVIKVIVDGVAAFSGSGSRLISSGEGVAAAALGRPAGDRSTQSLTGDVHGTFPSQVQKIARQSPDARQAEHRVRQAM
ncbi:hypothetical protein [Streptomyces sp. NPDC048496]|uniref:hypothetical protein n=1 Tax=Streptomyces sp. NPDC048496 TaxID=3365558 RepID=UPI00371CC754